MTAAILISIVVVLLTTGVRLAFFMVAAKYTLEAKVFTWHRFFCLMLGIYASHLFDIVIYALAYYFAWHVLEIGTLSGVHSDTFTHLLSCTPPSDSATFFRQDTCGLSHPHRD